MTGIKSVVHWKTRANTQTNFRNNNFCVDKYKLVVTYFHKNLAIETITLLSSIVMYVAKNFIVIELLKTFTENWVSKQSFFVLILIFFFRNKTFLFFKIESWNFQHLFEKEFHETSQNFNSFRQPKKKWKPQLSEWAKSF